MSFVLELPLKEMQCFDPTKSKLNSCFVICKHDIYDYNGEDFSWVDLKHIPYCKARYMDHVTRAFKCQYHIVTVSLVHFSTTSLFKQSSRGPLKKADVVTIDGPKLIYMVVDRSMLASTDLNPSDMEKPVGGCMLAYEGFIYPSFFSLYVPHLGPPGGFSWGKLGLFHAIFQGHQEFQNYHEEHTIIPGMKISSFFEFHVTTEETSLTFSKIRVHCREYLTKKRADGYSCSLIHEHIIYSSNEVYTLTAKYDTIVLPSTMFSGVIPMLNPTSCNGDLYRQYDLTFTMNVEGRNICERATDHDQVTIAKDCRSSLPRHPVNYSESPSYSTGYFSITGKFNVSSFNPLNSGNNFITELMMNGTYDRKYESHVTFSYNNHVTDEVFTSTIVKWCSGAFVKALVKPTFKFSRFLRGIFWEMVYPKNTPLIVFEGRKPFWLYGGVLYRYKNVSYSIRPSLLPQVFEKYQNSFHMESCPLSGIVKSADILNVCALYMRAKYVTSFHFPVPAGCRLAFPGISLKDFVRVSFEMSAPTKAANCTLGDAVHEFEISRIEILAIEIMEYYCCSTILECKQRATRIHEINCTFKVRWSPLKTHEDKYSINLPTSLLDCKLPKLKPSFISERLRRWHKLLIKVFILAKIGPTTSTTTLFVGLPFNMGELKGSL